MMDIITIRPIAIEDNKDLARVLRRVLVEMGVPKVGTAYEDEALDNMYEAYNEPRKQYFVVAQGGNVVGGAGIAPLEGGDPNICELQKMYFLSELRGKGVGFKMMEKCLDFARSQNFTTCYLETMPYMEAARKLYNKTGFTDLKAAMGNTGHYSCESWMIKTL